MLTKKLKYNPEDPLISKQMDTKPNSLNYQPINQRKSSQQNPQNDKREAFPLPSRKDIETNQDDFKRQYDVQSRRILELQNYKALCENYIEKAVPSQKLPLCQNDLKNVPHPQFPSIEPTEEILKLQAEKESLHSTLQKETVLNEQQRNYIEILKQTIESSILKNGLGNILQCSKAFQSQSTIDSIIDLSRSQNEIEKSRKDLAMALMLNSELKAELDSSKKSFEDQAVLCSVLKEKLNREKLINADFMHQCGSQEQALLSFEATVKEGNEQMKTLKASLSDYQSLSAKYEKEIFENGRKLNEMSNTISSYQTLQKKYNENKELYDRLDIEHQRLSKDKSDVDIANHKLKEEVAKLKEQIRAQCDEMAQKEEVFHKEKKTLLEDKEAVRRSLTKSENKNVDIGNIVQLKDKELREGKEQLISLEKQLMHQQAQMKDLSEDYETFKSKAETTAQIDTEKIIQYTQKLSNLSKHISNLELDCETFNAEAYKLKDANRKYQIDLEQLHNEKDKEDALMKNLTAQYDALLNSFRQLEIDSNRLKIDNDGLGKELGYWREKYSKDLALKSDEAIAMGNTVKKLAYQNDELIKKSDRLQFDLQQRTEEKEKGEVDLNRLRSEVISLKNESDVLQRTLAERSKVVQSEEQANYELTGQLNSSLAQLKELSNEATQLKAKSCKLEGDLMEMAKLNDSLKESNAHNDQRLTTLTQSLNAHCKSINQSIELLAQYAQRFIVKLKADSTPLPFYSRNFVEYMNDIVLSQQKLNALSPIDKLNEVQVFLSQLTIENFNWLSCMKELFTSISDYSKKATVLQSELDNCGEALKEKDSSLLFHNSKLKEIASDNDSVKRAHDALMGTVSSQQEALSSASYELNCAKEENNQLRALTLRVNEENERKDKQLANAAYQVEALEERIAVLAREKKNFEEVIEKLGQTSGNKETMRTVNSILSVCDDISQLERQKMTTVNKGRNDSAVDRQLQAKMNEYNHLCDSIDLSGRSGFVTNERLMTYEYGNSHNKGQTTNNTNCNSMRLDDTAEHLSTNPNNINLSNSSYSNKPQRSSNVLVNKYKL